MAVSRAVITEDRSFILAADIKGMVHVFSVPDLLVGKCDLGESFCQITAVDISDK